MLLPLCSSFLPSCFQFGVSLQTDPYSTSLPARLFYSYPLLRSIPLPVIRRRFATIRLLNQKLAIILPLIDFSQAAASWSLSRRISSLSFLIFYQVKATPWNQILRQTEGRRSGASVMVNRSRAVKAREKGDPEGKKSVFGQIYRQLHFLRPAALRSSSGLSAMRGSMKRTMRRKSE